MLLNIIYKVIFILKIFPVFHIDNKKIIAYCQFIEILLWFCGHCGTVNTVLSCGSHSQQEGSIVFKPDTTYVT